MGTTAQTAPALSREPAPAELESLIQSLDDGVLVVEEGYVVGANRALARMLGLPGERLFGMRVAELLATADGRPIHQPRSADGLRLRDADGELVPVSLHQVTERLYLVLDRARERRLEREVWRLSEELRRLGRDLPAGLPSQGELLGMIEHEIRTATTVIRGYSRMLLDERVGSINSTQHGFLCETRRATERIQALLDNLLAMASLDATDGPGVLRRPQQLHEIARAALEETRPLFADRGQRLECSLDAPDDAVFADAGRLQRVIVNLLQNARKFAPEDSRVHLFTYVEEREVGGRVHLVVEDEGPGVTREEAERIFRPFVQGCSTASGAGAEGVGLGLAICQRIMEAHEGGIEAVPDAGRGLFRLWLPLERQEG